MKQKIMPSPLMIMARAMTYGVSATLYEMTYTAMQHASDMRKSQFSLRLMLILISLFSLCRSHVEYTHAGPA